MFVITKIATFESSYLKNQDVKENLQIFIFSFSGYHRQLQILKFFKRVCP